MKMLSRILFALCLLVVVNVAHSQSSGSAHPSAVPRTISNYDINAPAVWIENPGVQGEFAYTGFGERFTLNGGSGFLDSIRIHFDSLSGDIIQVGVFTDVVRETSRGTFHLADYSFAGLIARFEFDISSLDTLRDVWITIPADHIEIPKDFHIGIGANQLTSGSDEYTSMFRLLGERHIGQEATIDSRSDILLTQDFLNFTTDVFDGFFTSGGRPLGIDFHIDAIVDETPSEVKTLDNAVFTVYPNPALAAGTLHVTGGDHIRSVKLYDMLGNEAAAWLGGSYEFQLPSVAQGIYTLVVTDASGSRSTKLLVH